MGLLSPSCLWGEEVTASVGMNLKFLIYTPATEPVTQSESSARKLKVIHTADQVSCVLCDRLNLT